MINTKAKKDITTIDIARTHTHARTHARTHSRTPARTPARTHTRARVKFYLSSVVTVGPRYRNRNV